LPLKALLKLVVVHFFSGVPNYKVSKLPLFKLENALDPKLVILPSNIKSLTKELVLFIASVNAKLPIDPTVPLIIATSLKLLIPKKALEPILANPSPKSKYFKLKQFLNV